MGLRIEDSEEAVVRDEWADENYPGWYWAAGLKVLVIAGGTW